MTIDHIGAFVRGATARKNGRVMRDCPYFSDEFLHAYWMSGWRCGRLE